MNNYEIQMTLYNLYSRISFNNPTKKDIEDFILVINYILNICRENNVDKSKDLDKLKVINKRIEEFFEDFNCLLLNLDENIYDINKIIDVLDDIMNTLKLKPITYENILRSKVYLMFKLKKCDEAEEIMKKYIDAHPKNVYAYVELVDDFVMIKNKEKAKYYYELGIINRDILDLDILEDRYEEVYK